MTFSSRRRFSSAALQENSNLYKRRNVSKTFQAEVVRSFPADESSNLAFSFRFVVPDTFPPNPRDV